jgi:hypothetical protein
MAAKILRTLALAGVALLGATAPSAARVHGQMYCWGYDLEFPVPCDYGEEEEEAAPQPEDAMLCNGIAPLRPSLATGPNA